MATPRRPSMVVIAGPNGSGKTTITQTLRYHEWFGGCHYINADDIARRQFGDWNSPDAVWKAAREAVCQREACLANKENLAFETVLSTDRNLRLIERARQAGYFIRQIFVGTDHPDINVRRVAERKRTGGHDVPEDKIRSRYTRSLKNLVQALSYTDRGHVIDNSYDGQQPLRVFRTEDGIVANIYQDPIPGWCDRTIALLKPHQTPDTN